MSTFKFNGNVEALSRATQTNQYQDTDFALGDDPSAVLDRYLGRKGAQRTALERGSVSTMICNKDHKD